MMSDFAFTRHPELRLSVTLNLFQGNPHIRYALRFDKVTPKQVQHDEGCSV